MREAQTLSLCLANYLVARAKAAVMDSDQAPLLRSYSSDGTPLRTQLRVCLAHCDENVKREGKRTLEYLMQLAFYRFRDFAGQWHDRCLFKPPLPLTEGKATPALFAAYIAFDKTLRQQGKLGIVVEHYSFDRAVWRPLTRLIKQHHLELAPTFGNNPTESRLLALQEWVESTPCSAHDAHNSLKWAMHFHMLGKQFISDLVVVFASIRNSYDLIVTHICQWLLQRVAFTPDDALPAPTTLYAQWTALRVEPALAEHLAEDLRLHWDPAAASLRIAYRLATAADALEDISGSLLRMWHFSLFSDSRWVTIGRNCRTLTAALISGFEPLMQLIKDDGHSSLYYLNGLFSSSVQHFGRSLLPQRWSPTPATRYLLPSLKTIGSRFTWTRWRTH